MHRHRPGTDACSSGTIPRSRGILIPAECHQIAEGSALTLWDTTEFAVDVQLLRPRQPGDPLLEDPGVVLEAGAVRLLIAHRPGPSVHYRSNTRLRWRTADVRSPSGPTVTGYFGV